MVKATYGHDANGNQTDGTDTYRLAGQLVGWSEACTAANKETDLTATRILGESEWARRRR